MLEHIAVGAEGDAAIASFIRLKQHYIPQEHFEAIWHSSQKTPTTNKTWKLYKSSTA
ncbi:hypothetical protein [Nodosilinea sp. FACHB-13]|uniref:hypothetical protein n=1 Tax=Cyanophyceae TaxID=3028117 RepID=UPI001682C137|nr:hypothetical protein [Nodosilinea sp. FACHB-13]MBD2105513.1 hypothetical protein [Nodosilinea sp. FACHB-13]